MKASRWMSNSFVIICYDAKSFRRNIRIATRFWWRTTINWIEFVTADPRGWTQHKRIFTQSESMRRIWCGLMQLAIQASSTWLLFDQFLLLRVILTFIDTGDTRGVLSRRSKALILTKRESIHSVKRLSPPLPVCRACDITRTRYTFNYSEAESAWGRVIMHSVREAVRTM